MRSIIQTGTVGRPLTLQCPFPSHHKDNRKFLCKGENRLSCTDMVTSGSRFTLQDNMSSSSFLVTISEVKPDDAGTYWCGSDSQWSMGNYTKIQLSVGENIKREKSKTDHKHGSILFSKKKTLDSLEESLESLEENYLLSATQYI